jgi:hypothetical protein
VSTRLSKAVDGGYATVATGTCDSDNSTDSNIMTATECFTAAKSVGLTGKQSHHEGTNASFPAGCSASSDGNGGTEIYFNKAPVKSAAKCGAGVTKVMGNATSLINVLLRIDAPADKVTLTLTGPSDVWFGVGFDAQAMKDTPWAVIVDGTGKVSERKLQDQSPGSELTASVTVVSSKVNGGLRTVVLTRAMKGASSDYYTFSLDTPKIPFINAIGNGPAFAYHKTKNLGDLSLVPLDGSTCICALKPAPFGKGKGKITYVQQNQSADTGSGTVGFGNSCGGANNKDLLDGKNPTCDIRSYTGGQIACHHMWSLLDADQEIPWADQPQEFHLKFRFWYQEYTPPTKEVAATDTAPVVKATNASHVNVHRTTWGIGSPVEYDVPKCNKDVLGCTQQPDGNWIHTIRGNFKGHGKLVAAHFHCHAPTCLKMTMYNNKTGEVICEERPIYGGSGKIPEERYDEPGYILQPPCL